MAGIIDYLDAYDRLTQECRARPHPIFRRARAKLKCNIMRKWMGTKARVKELTAKLLDADAYNGYAEACEMAAGLSAQRVKELEAAPKEVWVLHYGNYYPREVGAICGTKEAAERALSVSNPDSDMRIERWDIEQERPMPVRIGRMTHTHRHRSCPILTGIGRGNT